MQISVIGRHIELGAELRSYVENKVGKLGRYYDRLQSVEVIVDGEGVAFGAEIVAKADSHVFVAKERGEDIYAAVDMVMDKVERQITKQKERTRNRKHKADRRTPEAGGEIETSSTT